MNPLAWYYLHQAGRGCGDESVGPKYSKAPFLKRDHGIGSILGGLWRSFVHPLLWQLAKAMNSESLITRRNVLRYMAHNTYPKAKICDIVRRNMVESAHKVIHKFERPGEQTYERDIH
jgi:hypothetical protein